MGDSGRPRDQDQDPQAASSDDPDVVVLGFDALSWRYIDAFDLPNFATLRDRGLSAPLASTFPPWTGSAWPSMYTGVDPGHHGTFSFFDFDGAYPDEADLISRNDVDAPALWNYLTALGRSSLVVNVPVTHPAEPIDGVLVPGYLAPEDAAGYPPEVRREIGDTIGEPYRIYASDETGDADEAMLDSFIELIDLRRRTARALLETRDADVAVFQVQKTDTVFHKFDTQEAFRRVYQAADEFLGTVLEAVGEDTNLVVCSDHGIGPARRYTVYVNEILKEAGFVARTEDGTTPTLGGHKPELSGADSAAPNGNGVTSKAVSGLAAGLQRAGIQPGDVYAAASRLGVEDVLRRLIPDTDTLAGHVDWARSAAYCRSGPELGVRLNLAGREPAGVIEDHEYEAVRRRVIDVLEAVDTPDGSPAFDWVKPREAVYDGPHADAACDVLFSPAGMNNLVATNLVGRSFVPIEKYAHKPEGVFIGAGPGFDGTAVNHSLDLPDVAPIVMALAGHAVPARMTGRAPSELLRVPVEIREYDDPPYGTASPDEPDEAVAGRLEDLGYI